MRKVLLSVSALCALAACGDPLAGVERVSEIDPIPTLEARAALPSDAELASEGSVLSELLPGGASQPEASTTAVEVDLVADQGAVAPEATSQRGRVLSWLRRAASAEAAKETPQLVKVVTTYDTDTDGDKLASVSTANEPVLQPDLVEPNKRRGLFGVFKPAVRTGPDARDVPLGTALAFGEIARVCEAKPGLLGKLVDEGARKGRGYKLYDTAPDRAGARTFYVTGFDDNCPRQFTASLALFGAPEFHEQLRYGLPAKQHPYSTTDQAYEQVKSKVCHVGKSEPCGTRLPRLEKTTVFISVYENFGANARWADMLFHDGAVVAAALKSR